MLPPSAPSSSGSGGTLVALDGRPLPLRRADLRVRARGGLARTVLEQTFVNPHAEPLRVTYTLPLPADGAVSGFRFRIDDREVVGEVDRRARARERFEEALVQGHTAAIVEQERSSVFTQEVGNIPPGATVIATIEVDQPLAWRTDAGQGRGGWEYRFPTVVAPRYLGAEGRVADASRIEVAVADRKRPIAMTLQLRIDDALATGGLPSSPSHALSLVHEISAKVVGLADDSAGLDRDVVVRWPVATPAVGLSIDAARAAEGRATATDAFGLVTLVPPVRPTAAVPRDLIVLLDTSGSMGGEPLAQAQRLACALVEGLREHDRLELIEFSTAARRFSHEPLPATAKHREQAIAWIRRLSAGGGTEMRTGILAALEGLRAEAQRQIVLITDGHIGFEDEVLGEIAQRLPAGSRVHTVGVGSSVNRSLTQAAARAGRGLELIVGIGEDPEPATARLLARTEAPLVVDLELSGEALREHAPQRLPDLFAGSPALVAARLRPEGGELLVRGRTAHGAWQARVEVPARAPGEGSAGVIARFGREKVEDLELRRAMGEPTDGEIEALGVRFQLATRLTSWIAVSKEAMVDPGAPTRHEDVPQELPYGMSVEGLGLRMAGGGMAKGRGGAAVPRQAAAPMPGSAGPAGAPRSRSQGVARPAPARTAKTMVSPPSRPAAAAPAAKPVASPPPPPPAKAKKAEERRAVEKESEAAKGGKGLIGRLADAVLGRQPAPEADAEAAAYAEEAKPAAPREEADAETTGAFAAIDAGARRDVFSEITSEDIDNLFGPDGAAPATIQLVGRIVLVHDDRLVIEVDVRSVLSWRPPASIVALAADSEQTVMSLLPKGTTAAAELQPGMKLRLVLERSEGAALPVLLQVDLGDRMIMVGLVR